MKKIRLLLLITLLLFTITFTAGAYTIKGQTYPGSRVTLDVDKKIELMSGDNPQGNFVFKDIDKGEYRIKIENSDFKMEEIKRKIDSDTDLGKIYLEPRPGFIAGTVFYKDEKLPDVEVKLIDLNKTVKTDQDGNFSFEDIPVTYKSGPHKVLLDHEDFKLGEAKVYIGHNRLTILNKELEARPGKIYGETIPGTDVIVEGHKTEADRRGEFELRGIHPGRYRVRFKHPDYYSSEEVVTVPVNDGKKVSKILKPKLGSIEGHTLEDSIVNVNHKSFNTEDGNFKVENLKPGKYEIEINRTGYISLRKEYDLTPNEEINMGNINLELKKYVETPFQEDAWLGAFFLDGNLKEKYYPFLNIRRRRINREDPDSVIKLILSNYVLAQNTSIIKDLNSGEEFNKVIDDLREVDPLLVDRELYLINHLKKEIEELYEVLKHYSDYKYRFYHFKLIRKRKNRENDDSLLFTEKLVNKTSLKNQQFQVNNQLFRESRDTTQIINDMLPGEYENLIEYIKSPLVSLNKNGQDKDAIKITRISYIEFDVEDIKEIVKFFDPFTKDLIKNEDLKLDEWIKWKEVTHE